MWGFPLNYIRQRTKQGMNTWKWKLELDTWKKERKVGLEVTMKGYEEELGRKEKIENRRRRRRSTKALSWKEQLKLNGEVKNKNRTNV